MYDGVGRRSVEALGAGSYVAPGLMSRLVDFTPWVAGPVSGRRNSRLATIGQIRLCACAIARGVPSKVP